MSIFGCHSCGVNLEDYKDKPWDEVPCATCALAKDYSRTFSTGLFETGDEENNDSDAAEGSYDYSSFPDEHVFILKDRTQLKENELESLETIKKAIENQLMATFSGVLVKLFKLATKNPIMFEIVIKKMQFPYMSYSELGNTMEPKCSKQNVLYHLKSAVEAIPELEHVMLIDTRYTSGHYALKTVANKRREEEAEKRVQTTLYGGVTQIGDSVNIKELNKILRAPFMVREEAFNFNAYTADEEHLHGTSASSC